MEPPAPPPPSYKGSLLLAAPSLRGDSFYRAVLLLTEHRHDLGAHGYILNRPLGKTVGDLLPSPEFAPLAKVPVCAGGPVSPGELTFASFHWRPKLRRLTHATHLSMDEAVQRLEMGETVRAFAGYAGWAGGQLESELRRHAWVTRRPEADLLSPERAPSLWTDLLSGMGPFYQLLAGTPEDPSLN